MTAEPGWYPDAQNPGTEWFWDGSSYSQSRQGAIFTFAGKINGQKTSTKIFTDRIEWSWSSSSGVSGGKIAAGVLTSGVSLMFTGIGKGRYGIEKNNGGGVVRLADVTGVTFEKASGDSVLTVTTAATVVNMAVPGSQAQRIFSDLNGFVATARSAEAAATPPKGAANVSAGPSDAAAIKVAQISALSGPHVVENLEKLANLRFQRLISEEEYNQMKAKLLGD